MRDPCNRLPVNPPVLISLFVTTLRPTERVAKSLTHCSTTYRDPLCANCHEERSSRGALAPGATPRSPRVTSKRREFTPPGVSLFPEFPQGLASIPTLSSVSRVRCENRRFRSCLARVPEILATNSLFLELPPPVELPGAPRSVPERDSNLGPTG